MVGISTGFVLQLDQLDSDEGRWFIAWSKFCTSHPQKWLAGITVVNRWDEKAGLRTGCCTLPSYRRARSTDKKETGNEEG